MSAPAGVVCLGGAAVIYVDQLAMQEGASRSPWCVTSCVTVREDVRFQES